MPDGLGEGVEVQRLHGCALRGRDAMGEELADGGVGDGVALVEDRGPMGSKSACCVANTGGVQRDAEACDAVVGLAPRLART